VHFLDDVEQTKVPPARPVCPAGRRPRRRWLAPEVPATYNRGMRVKLAGTALVVLFSVWGVDTTRAGRTVFADEFNGTALDRTHWNVIITGRTVNDEQQAYVDSPDVLRVKDGHLEIQPRFRAGFKTPEGRSFDFISGRIDTRSKVAFTYGTAAARIRLTAGAGLWPAFWALGDGRWPDIGEIDIMENVGDPTWMSVALHGPGYSGDTPLVKRAPVDVTGWHIYSVDWTSDLLVFKVDSREIYRVSREMVEKYGKWAFDNPKHLIVNFALGGGYPFGVNKVSTPYHGLPDATVRAIQDGKVMMLVDWVRVTSN
jgi:beta-glucanase (GH16 family)